MEHHPRSTDISVRRATDAADFAQASALVHDLVEWIRVALQLELQAEQPALLDELDALAEHYSGPDGALFLASLDELTVGALGVRCDGDAAELKRMYVRPVARGRGAADALIEASVAFASQAGCRSLWLETMRGGMDPAIAVYRRNGFAVVDDHPPTLAAVDGIVVMRRPLEPQPCLA
jgi:GNAT superfamily N-acetyltransferase